MSDDNKDSNFATLLTQKPKARVKDRAHLHWRMKVLCAFTNGEPFQLRALAVCPAGFDKQIFQLLGHKTHNALGASIRRVMARDNLYLETDRSNDEEMIFRWLQSWKDGYLSESSESTDTAVSEPSVADEAAPAAPPVGNGTPANDDSTPTDSNEHEDPPIELSEEALRAKLKLLATQASALQKKKVAGNKEIASHEEQIESHQLAIARINLDLEHTEEEIGRVAHEKQECGKRLDEAIAENARFDQLQKDLAAMNPRARERLLAQFRS